MDEDTIDFEYHIESTNENGKILNKENKQSFQNTNDEENTDDIIELQIVVTAQAFSSYKICPLDPQVESSLIRTKSPILMNYIVGRWNRFDLGLCQCLLSANL